MKALRWIARYWYIPLLAFAGIAAWVMGMRSKPGESVGDELKAIDAKHKAKRLEAEKGKEVALATVRAEHRKELDALDDEQKRKADDLRADPSALAKFLVHAGSRRRRARNR